MLITEDNHHAMLDFWRDMIELAKVRGELEALENISTDIYTMLGYELQNFMGMPTPSEERGFIFASGCSHTESIRYD